MGGSKQDGGSKQVEADGWAKTRRVGQNKMGGSKQEGRVKTGQSKTGQSKQVEARQVGHGSKQDGWVKARRAGQKRSKQDGQVKRGQSKTGGSKQVKVRGAGQRGHILRLLELLLQHVPLLLQVAVELLQLGHLGAGQHSAGSLQPRQGLRALPLTLLHALV